MSTVPPISIWAEIFKHAVLVESNIEEVSK